MRFTTHKGDNDKLCDTTTSCTNLVNRFRQGSNTTFFFCATPSSPNFRFPISDFLNSISEIRLFYFPKFHVTSLFTHHPTPHFLHSHHRFPSIFPHLTASQCCISENVQRYRAKNSPRYRHERLHPTQSLQLSTSR